ncbi:MAG: fibronectin type III domain-containing protein, partial [Gammaproteobacteria bacterium]
YEFQIDSGAGFVTVQNTAATLYEARDLASDTTFTFRVRALNPAADTPASEWSASKTATTQATGPGPDPGNGNELTTISGDTLTTQTGDNLTTGA